MTHRCLETFNWSLEKHVCSRLKICLSVFLSWLREQTKHVINLRPSTTCMLPGYAQLAICHERGELGYVPMAINVQRYKLRPVSCRHWSERNLCGWEATECKINQNTFQTHESNGMLTDPMRPGMPAHFQASEDSLHDTDNQNMPSFFYPSTTFLPVSSLSPHLPLPCQVHDTQHIMFPQAGAHRHCLQHTVSNFTNMNPYCTHHFKQAFLCPLHVPPIQPDVEYMTNCHPVRRHHARIVYRRCRGDYGEQCDTHDIHLAIHLLYCMLNTQHAAFLWVKTCGHHLLDTCK